MKKLLFAFALIVMTSFAMNAQISANNSEFVFRGGKFYQNGIELSSGQLSSIIGQETFDSKYVPAKKLRTAGVACLSSGAAVFALGAGLAVFGVIDGNSSEGNAFGGMVEVGVGGITAAVGAVAAITGGILMGSANRKLKNIRPASSGIGLAFAF